MVSASLTLLRTQSDERLIVLARAGHERAFEAIVERYRRPLLRHGRGLLGEARAEEAVQQAFLAAWAALQRGDDVRHLSGWLHRIVHNTALNALRGERDDHAELRDWLEGAGAPEDELERREMLRNTLANLAALPARQREALLRIAVDGQSAEEVGTSLGLTEGAVRQLLYRARTALRAAATALTPMPLAGWLARAEPLTDRLAEVAGGAGSAGLSSILAKTSMVVVVGGAAVTGPPAIDGGLLRESRAPAEPSRVAAAATRQSALEVPAREVAPGSGVTGRAPPFGRSGSGGLHDRGPGSSGSRSGDSDNSGSGSGGSDNRGSGSGDSDNSGSGSSGSGSSDSDDSGSGSSSSRSVGSGSSGSGSGGSLSSGSGSSGSLSSGSTSSGSGSSGSDDSDSSGSGSTGSDSDESADAGSSGSGSGGSDQLDG